MILWQGILPTDGESQQIKLIDHQQIAWRKKEIDLRQQDEVITEARTIQRSADLRWTRHF